MGWQPGQSGNLAGRTPVRASRKALVDATPAMLEELLRLACSGDLMAIKLVLDRTVPVLRAEAVPVSVSLPAAPSEAAREIVRLAAVGEIDVTAAESLVNLLSKAVAVEQVDELRAQLQTLLADRFKDIA